MSAEKTCKSKFQTVPIVSFEGVAYDCGRNYAEFVLSKYAGYRKYLDLAWSWRKLDKGTRETFELHAPYILDIYRGMNDVAGLPQVNSDLNQKNNACTSFAVSGEFTADNHPLCGQTKDTIHESMHLYIILKMCIKDGPEILVLAYPGEVLGYGLWSTGVCIMRNNLYSDPNLENGLTMEQWGLLALAGNSIETGIELANKYGLQGSGNCLIADKTGRSASIEFNKGGVDVLRDREGILVHANHPNGKKISRFEKYDDLIEKNNSRFREQRLHSLLENKKGELTASNIITLLADHENHPRGVCRHMIGQSSDYHTTAAIVADPSKMKLYVVCGNPCCNPVLECK
jgi:isopenicillin-N N-acyltransferase-like protein